LSRVRRWRHEPRLLHHPYRLGLAGPRCRAGGVCAAAACGVGEVIDREREERRQFCQGLHALANWLATNPHVPLPDTERLEAQVFHYEDAEEKTFADFKAVVQAAARSETKVDDNYYRVVVPFGEVSYEAWAPRSNVCTPRQVGTKTIPKREYVKVGTTEVPVYEFDCPPLLAPKGSA